MPQPCPAVSPDQTNDIERPVSRRGPEMPDLRFARYPACADVIKPHAVENILAGRKAFEQQF